MKISMSNIAWQAEDDQAVYEMMKNIGLPFLMSQFATSKFRGAGDSFLEMWMVCI